MVKLRYGNYNQVSFDSLEEYYYALGFLANSKNAEIYWENNDDSGAWGSEGRIHCLIPEEKFPQCFRFTAGNGSIYSRINCNEYVSNLISTHHFQEGGNSRNIQAIIDTVPDKYLEEFKAGYGDKVPPKKVISKPENKSAAIYNNPSVKIGTRVTHTTYGTGVIAELDSKYVLIDFPDKTRKFQNPEAFIRGFLKIVED